MLVVVLYNRWLLDDLHSVRCQACSPPLLDERVIVKRAEHEDITLVLPLHEEQCVVLAEVTLSLPQLRSSHIIRYPLPIGAQGTACFKPLLLQVLESIWTGVKVVCEDAVPLAPQPIVIEQLQYYPVCQAKGRRRRVNILPGVQLPVPDVPAGRVRQNPRLHPPLLWLLGHVLEEGQPSLEPDHALVNGEVLTRSVAGLEVLHHSVKKGANLVQLVILWLPPCRLLPRVVEVKKLQQELESTTGHHFPEVIILKWPAVAPVTPVSKKSIHSIIIIIIILL